MKRQVRLSTKRYSRAKICGFAPRELEIAQRNAYFLQLSKIARPVHLLPIGTSPLPAERGIGLEPNREKTCYKIKNPATSAGRIRPFFEAAARCVLRTDALEACILATRCS